MKNVLFILLITTYITGCTGAYTFNSSARAGDTVAITLDTQQANISRSDVSVIIIDSNSIIHTIPANDPKIRALVNTYPDPLSKIIVGTETNQNIDGSETIWGNTLTLSTNYDKEWFQTILFLDLPSTLATGPAQMVVKDQNNTNISLPSIEILSGTGSQNTFDEKSLGPVPDAQILALERGAYYNISFSGSTVPHAIEINMTHNPDVDNGGAGRAYVVNPRGDIKNINWSDDGANLKVILMPTRN